MIKDSFPKTFFLHRRKSYYYIVVDFLSFLATDGRHLLYDAVDQLPLFPLATNSISFVLGSSCHVCTCPGKSLLSHQRSHCILRMTLKLLWLPAISEKCFTTGISSEGEGQTYLLPIRYNPGLRFFCSASRPTLRTCISSRPCSYRPCALILVPHYL